MKVERSLGDDCKFDSLFQNIDSFLNISFILSLYISFIDSLYIWLIFHIDLLIFLHLIHHLIIDLISFLSFPLFNFVLIFNSSVLYKNVCYNFISLYLISSLYLTSFLFIFSFVSCLSLNHSFDSFVRSLHYPTLLLSTLMFSHSYSSVRESFLLTTDLFM